MSGQKSIVVVGSGPGIGSSTALEFATNGFSVVLLSRTESKLSADASRIEKAVPGAKVATYAVDIGDTKAFKSTLEKVKQEHGNPEVVLFNAARVSESKFGEESEEAILQDFKVMNIALYTTAVWALPLLASHANTSSANPSFFMTGSAICLTPFVTHFALAMQKAAQFNFANSFKQIANPKGVHVATIFVNGPVSDDHEVLNAKNIAGTYWTLFNEEKSQWRDVVDVGKRP